MRLLVHAAALAALLALGIATGRWLRDPNLGGLVLLLAMVVVAAVSMRRLYGRRREPAGPPPPPPRGRPRPDLERARAAPEVPLWAGEDAPDKAGPAVARPVAVPSPDPRVDLNRAGLEDLQRLPGVGPVAAQRVLDDRAANGPFATIEALARVPGFGPAKVRALADRARV